jgi:hypothetical protein
MKKNTVQFFILSNFLFKKKSRIVEMNNLYQFFKALFSVFSSRGTIVLFVFYLFGLIGVNGQTTIWSENFDGSWTTNFPTGFTAGTTTSDVAWHRNDYTTGWSFTTSGSPSSSGANSTSYYARYHSYGISTLNANPTSQMTKNIDLSAYLGSNVIIGFYYINPSGTDVLRLRMSSDAGVSYSTIQTYSNASSWTYASVTISSVYLVSGFRLRFVGVSDYGNDDIGLDEITITQLAPCSGVPNPGAAAISSSSGCSGVNFTLSASGLSTGTGISYQWQSSPTGLVGSWSNITGANSSSLTTSASSTTYYQLVTTCSNSGLSNTTTNFVSYNVSCINMSNGSVTTCSMDLFDSQGPSASYLNSENYTLTIFPAIVGAKVQLSFSSFSTESGWDGMMIYNGNSTASPLISSGLGVGSDATTCPAGSWRGTGSPGTITSSAADGSLTIVFKSDGSTVSSGWAATITCYTPCTNSVAPTSITGTTSICIGQSTSLISAGGSSGTEAEDVWYEGGCPIECYTQEFISQPFTLLTTTQNSVTNGILNVTSTNGDAGINMTNIGTINTATCRWINIRYRVITGTGGLTEIYFTKNGGSDLSESQVVRGNLVSDNQWNILNIDMAVNPYWYGNITGWRYDWCTNSGVNMEIDFITLSSKPIVGVGSPVSLSPTTTATYYTAKKGSCNTTSCASQTITVNPIPATIPISGSSPICPTATTQLNLNYPTGGTISTVGGYRYHVFTSSGSLVVPSGFIAIADVLVVAGGGGGGSGRGGGGGAGGLILNTNYTLSPGTISATVGSGGAVETNGSNSIFGSLTATGGGRGASHNGNPSITANNGQSGGSGGGGAINYLTNIFVGGAATLGQGNIGGQSGLAGSDDPRNTGGGGGAGEVGRTGSGGNATWTTGTSPKGGDGLLVSQFSDVAGSPAGWFAGGGGGSKAGSDRTGAPGGTGGQGGGGAGSATGTSSTSGVAGTPNTGGGGGGGDGIINTSTGTMTTTGIGGSGGSGVVIVRYYVGNGGTWSSDNNLVASVDINGLVSAASGGSANISYAISGLNGCIGSTSSYTFLVSQPPTIISISPP